MINYTIEFLRLQCFYCKRFFVCLFGFRRIYCTEVEIPQTEWEERPLGRRIMIDKNDYRTPRERVDQDFLTKLIDECNDEGTPACACNTTHSAGYEAIPHPFTHPLAMVVSPPQAFTDLYEVDAGLAAGTIFAQLNLPFKMAKCRKGGICND